MRIKSISSTLLSLRGLIDMNFKKSRFSIFDKERREMEYIKGVYKKKIQSEIESYKDTEDEDKRDTIEVQDVLMLDIISI